MNQNYTGIQNLYLKKVNSILGKYHFQNFDIKSVSPEVRETYKMLLRYSKIEVT